MALTPEEEAKQDVAAAMAYLGGIHEKDRHGVPRQRFCSDQSKEGLFCRAALARVLRSEGPLDRQLREMLADMFDTSPRPAGLWNRRVLKASTPKKQKDHIANTHKTWFVWERVKAGTGINEAVEEAASHFQEERGYIYRLWKIHKPIYEATWGPIGRASRKRS